MADRTWKAVERLLCRALGWSRNPGSGAQFGRTRADCQDVRDRGSKDRLFRKGDAYIEVKHSGGGKSKRPASVLTLWEDTAKKAAQEGRRFPILLHHKHGSSLTVATIPLETLIRLLTGADRARILGD